MFPGAYQADEPNSNAASKAAAKPRAILDRDKAEAIFKIKKENENGLSGHKKLNSIEVARKFGVGEKTVRDIWRGRTWIQETQHLDPSRPVRAAGLPGRPLGRKDTAPRKRSVSLQSSPQRAKHREDGEGTSPGMDESDPFHEDWPNWAGADRPPEVGADAIPAVRTSKEPSFEKASRVAAAFDAHLSDYSSPKISFAAARDQFCTNRNAHNDSACQFASLKLFAPSTLRMMEIAPETLQASPSQKYSYSANFYCLPNSHLSTSVVRDISQSAAVPDTDAGSSWPEWITNQGPPQSPQPQPHPPPEGHGEFRASLYRPAPCPGAPGLEPEERPGARPYGVQRWPGRSDPSGRSDSDQSGGHAGIALMTKHRAAPREWERQLSQDSDGPARPVPGDSSVWMQGHWGGEQHCRRRAAEEAREGWGELGVSWRQDWSGRESGWEQPPPEQGYECSLRWQQRPLHRQHSSLQQQIMHRQVVPQQIMQQSLHQVEEPHQRQLQHQPQGSPTWIADPRNPSHQPPQGWARRP